MASDYLMSSTNTEHFHDLRKQTEGDSQSLFKPLLLNCSALGLFSLHLTDSYSDPPSLPPPVVLSLGRPCPPMRHSQCLRHFWLSQFGRQDLTLTYGEWRPETQLNTPQFTGHPHNKEGYVSSAQMEKFWTRLLDVEAACGLPTQNWICYITNPQLLTALKDQCTPSMRK